MWRNLPQSVTVRINVTRRDFYGLQVRHLVFIFLFEMAAFAGTPKVATDTEVFVFVEGHGTLPDGAWYSTKALVSSIFDQIYVHVNWRDREPVIRPSLDRIVIRLHFAATPSTGTRKQSSICASGFACTFPFNIESPTVFVMHERVRSSIRRPRLFQAVLAHIMAHEITHVLEVRDTHSDTGIMKERWSAADLDLMDESLLEFTPKDIEYIQEGFDYHRRRWLKAKQ